MENKSKNSELYLKSVLRRKHGFTAPEKYFDNLEEQFNIENTFSFFSKENAFSTPENYFNSFEDTIFEKIKHKEEKPKVISIRKIVLKLIPTAVAATIALIITLNYFTTDNEVNFDNLAQNEIETWILENTIDFTTQDISSYVALDDVNLNDFTISDINKNDIEDYMIYDDNITIINEIN